MKNIESVPVGYMTIKEVYPLDMEEFTMNLGMSDEVLDHVKKAFETLTRTRSVKNRLILQVTLRKLYEKS